MFKAKTTVIMQSGRIIRFRGGFQLKDEYLVDGAGDGYRVVIKGDAIAGTIVRYWWQRWPQVV